jgi:hypothetical protein
MAGGVGLHLIAQKVKHTLHRYFSTNVILVNTVTKILPTDYYFLYSLLVLVSP